MVASMVNNHFQKWDTEALAVVIGTAISLFMAVKLGLLVGFTFKEYRGLYFWSCVVATLGIFPYSIGFMMEYFKLSHLALAIALDTCGWSAMVTGQSFVLFSRLHLVYRDHKDMLRGIRSGIITVGLILHGATSIVAFLSNLGGGDDAAVTKAYNIIEPVQMTIFTFQELLLSFLYIVGAIGKLKTTDEKESRTTLYQVFLANVIIIVLDIVLLATEFSGEHVIQQTFKSVVYGIKLELELAILNKLKVLVHPNLRENTFGGKNNYLGPNNPRRVPLGSSGQLSTASGWFGHLENSSQQPINLEPNSIPMTSQTPANKPEAMSQDLKAQTEDSDVILPVVTNKTGRKRFSETALMIHTNTSTLSDLFYDGIFMDFKQEDRYY
ncbi:hypothetical protein DM02DRAFT_710839 [Periconia macrospinosa]|uniref:DUF7703 domain-containing protein n=1 Tax=Periconia macrospinosa TaxID=97972 RepID=A0A2V1E7J9_9PLEO|nr:hypothetical protein DM02DRAFT_710839 [Periconia macrospinosa]